MRTSILFLFFLSTTYCSSQSLSFPVSLIDSDSLYNRLSQDLENAKIAKDSSKILKVNIILGEYYSQYGLYNRAIDKYKVALNSIDTEKFTPLLVDLKNDIGSIYFEMNNYRASLLFFEESLENAKRINYKKGIANSLSFIGTTLEKQGNYLKALKYQKESLSLFESIRDTLGIAQVNENIGSIHEDLTNYELAYDYFKKSFNILEGSKTRAEANVLNNIGDVHRKSGDFTKAYIYTQKSLTIAKELKHNDLIESAYKDLSKTYALQSDFEKAYQNKLEAETYRAKILDNQNSNQINVLQTSYEAQKRESQIQLLKEQNKVSKANLVVLFVISIAFLIVLVVVLFYFNKKRKTNLKLQNYKQQALKAELEKKEIEEKNLQRDIQLKTTALSRYSLHLSQKNKILEDLSKTLKKISKRKNIDVASKIKEISREIDFNLQQENEWEEFKIFFKEIHPDFIKKLSKSTEEHLSPSELKLSVLLRLNMSSKEIASILRVTPDSVRVARYRLRKKLPIESKDDLVSFMLAI